MSALRHITDKIKEKLHNSHSSDHTHDEISSHPHEEDITAVHSTTLAPTEEVIIKPVIIDEHVKHQVVQEIQPIIHKELEQTTVHHVEKHIYESAPSVGGTKTLQPIVQETVVPHHITEVQEIVHREKPVVQIEQVQVDYAEHAVLPPIHTSQAGPRSAGETVYKPVIVDEVMQHQTVKEIQPVIHKEIEQTTVHHIDKHIYESAPPVAPSVVKPALVEEVIVPHHVTEVQEIVHREVPVIDVHRVEDHQTQHGVLPAVHTTLEGQTAEQTREKVFKPVIVEEVPKLTTVKEIQPVIHKELEQPVVHHLEQHTFEKAPKIVPTITKDAIVQEFVVPHHVTEIQEVIHREVPVIEVENVQVHKSEHVVLPTVHTAAKTDEITVAKTGKIGAAAKTGDLPATRLAKEAF